MRRHHETRHDPQDRNKPNKVRRDKRREAIARKHSFLTEVLDTRH